MIDILKGILIGIGKILPGISGSLIAISLGVYYKSIHIIGNIYKINKNDLIFLSNLLIGICISIVLFSKLIINLLNIYYIQTMLLFLGLIIGCINGLLKIIKKDLNFKNIIFLLFPLLIILLINIINIKINISINYFTIFFLGILESITMILPGVSGTALFMYLNIYQNILGLMSTITLDSIIFITGIIIGFILFSKIISIILLKYKIKLLYVITGLMISTILIILKDTLNCDYDFISLLIGTILFVIGYFITKKYSEVI